MRPGGESLGRCRLVQLTEITMLGDANQWNVLADFLRYSVETTECHALLWGYTMPRVKTPLALAGVA